VVSFFPDTLSLFAEVDCGSADLANDRLALDTMLINDSTAASVTHFDRVPGMFDCVVMTYMRQAARCVE
jgi:hypothetical protein